MSRSGPATLCWVDDIITLLALRYHYVHHLSPCNNFGLTEPSDVIWDKLLGVNTVKKLEDLHTPSKDGKKRS
eukprot:1940479-Amphidinium_carterae.1